MLRNTKKDILNGNLYEQILILTIPLTGSYLLQRLYEYTDAIVLGRFAGVEAIAAVGGSANQIINILLNIITGVATGSMILVAQGFGKRDAEEIHKAIKTGMFVAIVFGGVIATISCFAAKPLLILMKTPEEIIRPSLIYMILYFIGLIPYSIYMYGMSMLRATGDTKISTLFVFVIAITKIIFDFLLTGLFNLGVWGVATSTLISYLICAVIVIIIFHRTENVYQYDITDFGYDTTMLKNIFKIGIPVAIQSAIFAITNAFVNIKINGFGTNTIAAYSIYNNVDNLYWSFSSAIAAAILTIVGQNYGNKNMKRVKETFKCGIIIDLVATLLIGAFEFFFGKYIFALFTTNTEVINSADSMIKYIAVVYPTYILVEVVSGIIKGCGDSVDSMIIAMVCITITRFGYLMFVKCSTPTQVTACYPLSWIVTSVVYLIYYLFNKKYRLRNTD